MTVFIGVLLAWAMQLPPAPPAPTGARQPQMSRASAANENAMVRLALEAAAGTSTRAIPLDRDGKGQHGVLFDRFLMSVAAARRASADGTVVTPEALMPRGLGPLDIAIVAFPVACGGKTLTPAGIDLSVAGGPMNGPVRARGPLLEGASVGRQFPGFQIPDGAIALIFPSAPLSSATAVIHYIGDECAGVSMDQNFSFQMAMGMPTSRAPSLKLAQDQQAIPWPVVVRVMGWLDQSGALRFPAVVEGPDALEAAAVAAAAEMRFQPYRMNGAPIAQNIGVNVTFFGEGTPTAPTPPRASDGPTPFAQSTVGGRLPEGVTTETPGLTVASSRCPITDDPAYGMSATSPIKVGGGAVNGPARERAYLNTLRGPAGQAIRFRRLGSTMAPDKTFLDMYEVSYAGMEKAVRLFVDQYHFDALKAPAGFACPSPFPLQKVDDIK